MPQVFSHPLLVLGSGSSLVWVPHCVRYRSAMSDNATGSEWSQSTGFLQREYMIFFQEAECKDRKCTRWLSQACTCEKRLHCSSTNATQNYYIKEKEMFLQNEGMLRTMPTCLAAGGPPATKPESWDTPPLLLQTALREKLPEASAPRNTRNPVWSLYLQHFISEPDDSETMIRQCLVQELSEQKQKSWSGHHPNHPSQTLKAEPNPNLNLEVKLLDLQKVQALY